MNAFHILPQVTAVITVAISLIALWVLIPIYKSGHHKGILILSFSYMLGIFVSVSDRVVDFKRMGYVEHVWYYCIRKGIYITDLVLFTIGVILIAKTLRRLSGDSCNTTMNGAEQPGGEERR